MMPRILRIGLLVTSLGLLGGCSTISDWLAPPEVVPPAKLQDIKSQVDLSKLWSSSVSGDEGDGLALIPAYAAGRLYVASADGTVRAMDADTGKVLWSVDTGLPLSGGPGVGDGMVLVGTSGAEVVALSASDGKQLWTTQVSSEVLSAPAIADGAVVVRTIDGKVTALDETNGKQLWRYERQVPVLTLRGNSAPKIWHNEVICGMAAGHLVALDLATGNVDWDTVISTPSGRSELDRLTGIDGDPLIRNGIAYVATYQGHVAAVDLDSGQILWRHKFSSYSSMAADQNRVYASDAEGQVVAMDIDTGKTIWKQDALHNRGLSDVEVTNGVVAVGDFEGYVHFLSAKDGKLIGRTRVGSDPIDQGMILADGILFVQGEGGDIAAMRVKPLP